MSGLKKIMLLLVAVMLVIVGVFAYWLQRPLLQTDHAPTAFTVLPNSSLAQVAQQIQQAGIPIYPPLFTWWLRLQGKQHQIKAGDYLVSPGDTPTDVMIRLIEGNVIRLPVRIIEGWTFAQMRKSLGENPALKQDSQHLSDTALLEKITQEYSAPEGLFFPDTYHVAKGTSDFVIYQQAYAQMKKNLETAWKTRDPDLPYKTPYEALIMASIIEKETGKDADRPAIAGVFVQRLKRGMLLQTDPTVIYGLKDAYTGRLLQSDLKKDTPYNTYTRPGLPPTPIALPGAGAITAAMRPLLTDALYFIGKPDGSSHFSATLKEHNEAVQMHLRPAKSVEK